MVDADLLGTIQAAPGASFRRILRNALNLVKWFVKVNFIKPFNLHTGKQ